MQIRLMPRRLMGQTIRGIRNRLGMSQAEFGESLGVEGSAVSKWEKGQTQPEYGTLAKIATMGLVDVLVFHETADAVALPQITPGEAAELRDILARMEALLADAKVLVERAANRTAVEVLEGARASAPPVTADALVLDAEVRLETRPRARSRTASASRATSKRSASSSSGRTSRAKGASAAKTSGDTGSSS